MWIWAVRDCPAGEVTVLMNKDLTGSGYPPYVAGVEVRARDEVSARQFLDSVDYRRGS
ncbi:hypothetical protein [Kribbella sp. NPDC048915]|uniref:hypothetical protein n=1 Tax=Kribbella sp. NPDC048915 TaxID=3155148 RepID=UPI0033FD3B57